MSVKWHPNTKLLSLRAVSDHKIPRKVRCPMPTYGCMLAHCYFQNCLKRTIYLETFPTLLEHSEQSTENAHNTVRWHAMQFVPNISWHKEAIYPSKVSLNKFLGYYYLLQNTNKLRQSIALSGLQVANGSFTQRHVLNEWCRKRTSAHKENKT